MTAEFIHSVPVSNRLGEGIVWNEKRGSVWWTDIQNSALFEYVPELDTLEIRDTPHRVACFGFVEGKDSLIVAFDRGIAFYDPFSGAIEWLVGPDALPDGLRFNDGKIDPGGRFWVGTMVEDPGVSEPASLYCFDPKAGLVEHVPDIRISNGLCWSPDAKVMYHADSPTGTIRAFRFDSESGTPSEPVTFAQTRRGVYPDGSTVDAGGGMWNAQWGGGQVLRYTTAGQVDLVVELPVTQPTCVSFGGATMDLLFVTSARQGLSEEQLAAEPAAGDLFVYRTGLKGLPAFNFK